MPSPTIKPSDASATAQQRPVVWRSAGAVHLPAECGASRPWCSPRAPPALAAVATAHGESRAAPAERIDVVQAVALGEEELERSAGRVERGARGLVRRDERCGAAVSTILARSN